MKNSTVYFVVAQGSLVVSVVLNRFFPATMPLLFLIGLFTSLSIVFNIVFLVKKGKEIRQKRKIANKWPGSSVE